MTDKRITIVIEDDQTRQTIEIPHATGVEWEVEYKDTNSYDIFEHQQPEIDTLSLSFSPLPDPDHNTHYIRNEGM